MEFHICPELLYSFWTDICSRIECLNAVCLWLVKFHIIYKTQPNNDSIMPGPSNKLTQFKDFPSQFYLISKVLKRPQKFCTSVIINNIGLKKPAIFKPFPGQNSKIQWTQFWISEFNAFPGSVRILEYYQLTLSTNFYTECKVREWWRTGSVVAI